MHTRTKLVLGATALVAAAIPAVAFAVGDRDTPIEQPDLARASAAALAHLGGGRVTDTEVGDEESYYEVEVTLPDGLQVDVQVDRSFAVVGVIDDDGDVGVDSDR